MTDNSKVAKELTSDFAAYVDGFDASLGEILHVMHAKHTSAIKTGLLSVSKVVELLEDALVNDKIKALVLRFSVELLKAAAAFTLLETLEHKTAAQAHAEFYLAFIMRLKALNYPYFVAAEEQIQKTETELRTAHDLYAMQAQEQKH
jgi:hypothetical protein